ncbi:MAG TPA: hypothetical protein VG796_23950 [Verrucomicrobiales bacterium]|nr:hypothetical protein [Verrucomicrobiales bacterium]
MKTRAEWSEVIEVTEHPGTGTSHHFESRCPVCGAVENSTFWSDGSTARKGAVGAVLFHIQREHPEEIEREMPLALEAEIAAREAMTKTTKIRLSVASRRLCASAG